MSEIRASSLPKLAECPCYEGTGGTSPAAERGTKIDQIIRECITAQANAYDYVRGLDIPKEDKRAIVFGVSTLRDLATDREIECREEYLAMHVPGLSSTGTADAVCEGKRWVADIKTGAIRNYREQLAAYALACMDVTWNDEWTAHVIYVDQKLVRSYNFTREQCERIVREVAGAASSFMSRPRPCEYCDWCRHKDHCKALVMRAKHLQADIYATSGDGLTIMRERILGDVRAHSDFVSRYKFFAKEFGDPLTDALRDRLLAGEEIEGWKLTNAAPRRYVDAADILPVIKEMSPEHVFYAMGAKMSADTFVEAAINLGIENPEQLVKTAPGTQQMRQVKSKKQN